MPHGETIFALSSGRGRAGVAVVRLSGPGAKLAVETLAGRLPSPRQAAFRRLTSAEGDLIDEALVLWFPGPRSETGEDMAEFQVHGSRAVLSALFRALGSLADFRMAEPGEFVRRAFLNGKVDLTQVEGIADLVDAETDAQRRQALRQVTGGLAGLYDRWRQQLTVAMALVEGAIDFSDEADVTADVLSEADEAVGQLTCEVRRHLAGAHRGEVVRDGFRVVLAGPPNVGKSSLLNALARRDVAIVSDEAGTTRDVLEVRLDLGGVPVVLTDTAGLRDAAGKVEQEGIRRTLARAEDADLVLWVVDALAPVPDPAGALRSGQAPILVVANKCDAVPPTLAFPADLQLSAKTGDGLDALTAELARRASDAAGDQAAGDLVPTSERQRLILQAALHHLEAFGRGRSDDRPIELLAEDLRLAGHQLGRLTGRIDAEDVLGAVFARFCIGK
jgi:tRNA modification GTPase